MKSGVWILFFGCLSLSIFAQNDNLFLDGVEKMAKGNFVEASEIFLNETYSNPSYSTFYNLGIASGELNDWNKAKWAFESALKFKPSDEKAQFNAKLATDNLNTGKSWEHPYSWTERLLISVDISVWGILAFLSSLLLGFFLFLLLSKKKLKNGKLMKGLFFPTLFIFVFSIYGLYVTNNHFLNEKYAILKENKTPFYLSPEGITIEVGIPLDNRMSIREKYTKDSSEIWIKVVLPNNEEYWLRDEDVWRY